MRITKSFNGYNKRRYGRPWIAKVAGWDGPRPDLAWGAYHGDDDGGYCEVEAAPGDIVRWGQKDNRGGNTSADWGIVGEGGEVLEVTAAAARTHWVNGKKT